MRALLDENMPQALVRLLAPEFEVSTVQREGWSGRKNGDLLEAAAATFDVFVTTDQGIPHQQNLSRYAIGIVLLEAYSNRVEDLSPLVPQLKERRDKIAAGKVLRVRAWPQGSSPATAPDSDRVRLAPSPYLDGSP